MSDIRTCADCGKPHNRPSSYCRDCQNERSKESYRRRKGEPVQSRTARYVCQFCGGPIRGRDVTQIAAMDSCQACWASVVQVSNMNEEMREIAIEAARAMVGSGGGTARVVPTGSFVPVGHASPVTSVTNMGVEHLTSDHPPYVTQRQFYEVFGVKDPTPTNRQGYTNWCNAAGYAPVYDADVPTRTFPPKRNPYDLTPTNIDEVDKYTDHIPGMLGPPPTTTPSTSSALPSDD